MKPKNPTPKIKTLLGLFLLFILLCSISTFALDITDSDANLGDTEFIQETAKLSFIDKIRLSFGSGGLFTVIDGAVCSTYPDLSGDYTQGIGTNELCYTNQDHTGVAFQLFQVTNDGWRYIGEQQVSEGERACFSGLTEGIEYHYDLYYCDSEAERTCTDTDQGIDAYDYGKVTFTLDGDSESYTDVCESNTVLLERYCIDDSVSSTQITCDQCSNGICVDDGCSTDNDCSSGYECDDSRQCIRIGELPGDAPLPDDPVVDPDNGDEPTDDDEPLLNATQIVILVLFGLVLVYLIFWRKK